MLDLCAASSATLPLENERTPPRLFTLELHQIYCARKTERREGNTLSPTSVKPVTAWLHVSVGWNDKEWLTFAINYYSIVLGAAATQNDIVDPLCLYSVPSRRLFFLGE